MPRPRSLSTTTELLPGSSLRSGRELPAREDEAGAAARRPERLSLSDVLVAAGTAAGTAALGVYFGPAGTVAGAVLGSVASTLAARTVHEWTPARHETE